MTYQLTQLPSQPPTGVKVLIFSLCPEKQQNIGSDKVTDKGMEAGRDSDARRGTKYSDCWRLWLLLDADAHQIQIQITCCNYKCSCTPNTDTNIAKGTTDPRVEFISQVITQILIKQFQNLD